MRGSATRRLRCSCRGSTATCSRRSPRPRTGDLDGTELESGRRGCGDGRARRAGVSGAQRLRGRGDRRASRLPRRAGALVFHGGTAMRDGTLVTNGGRILSVTGTAATVAEARAHAYAAAGMIRVRRDAAPNRHRGRHRWLSRSSGSSSAPTRTASACRPRMDELDARGIALGVRRALGAPHAGCRRGVREGARPRAGSRC